MLSSRVSADWWRIWRTGVSPGMDRLAVSARFPRDVAGSPALALGTGCSPGDPFAPAQNRQNRPPNGLQGPRSSRAGWSVRSWSAASATPVQQLPHRVPVDLHPRPRGTAALHIECSFPWGCGADRARDSLLPAGPPGKRPERAAASPACPCVRAFLLPRKSWAAARNRSIPRTADGNYQLVGQHPAVSGADGSSAAQSLIPATGPPGCRCGTSGSARPDRPR